MLWTRVFIIQLLEKYGKTGRLYGVFQKKIILFFVPAGFD